MTGRSILAALAVLMAVPVAAQQPPVRRDAAAVAEAAGFEGVVLVGRMDAAAPDVTTTGTLPPTSASARWPWASVTKQMIAVLVMQQVADGRLGLDDPAARHLPAVGRGGAGPTIRQLLQHRSGLRNPNDSPPDADGTPGFYTDDASSLAWCVADRGAPGGEWRYNNCDYLVLGAVLEAVSGQSVSTLFEQRIARSAGTTSVRFAAAGDPAATGGPERPDAAEHRLLVRYGAAGGLIGTAADLWAIDRALLDGRLLDRTARDVLWAGDPALGFMALGQWAFEAPLAGCAAPVRLIERRGEIGRFQIRNIVAPATGIGVILLTAREGQEFGEIWQGRGLSHDVLSAAMCP